MTDSARVFAVLPAAQPVSVVDSLTSGKSVRSSVLQNVQSDPAKKPRADQSCRELFMAAAAAHEREVAELKHEVCSLKEVMAKGTNAPDAYYSASWSEAFDAKQRKENEPGIVSQPVSIPASNMSKARKKSVLKLSTDYVVPSQRTVPDKSPREKQIMRFLNGPLDSVIGFVIVCNAVTLALEYEYEGVQASVHLGVTESSNARQWDNATVGGILFGIVSHIYNIIFIVELVVRFGLLRSKFWWNKGKAQGWAFFDTFIVLITSADLYVLSRIDSDFGDGSATFIRLLRLAKAVRALRIIRVMHLFGKLRILVRTVIMSFMSLFWSMCCWAS
jgi:hypothetical protein